TRVSNGATVSVVVTLLPSTSVVTSRVVDSTDLICATMLESHVLARSRAPSGLFDAAVTLMMGVLSGFATLILETSASGDVSSPSSVIVRSATARELPYSMYDLTF